MKHLITILALLMLGSVASAQTDLSGRITNQATNKPIANVNIRVAGSPVGTVTDRYGKYRLRLPVDTAPITIEFSHISYHPVKRQLRTDTLRENINLKLAPRTENLPEFEFSSGPEIVYGDQEYQLLDYTFSNDDVILLAYKKKAIKSQLLLVNKTEKLLDSQRVPRKAIELFSDCQQDNYVITQDFLFNIVREENTIDLAYAETNRYNHLVQPCVDLENPYFYFSRFGPGEFSIEYTVVDVAKGERRDLIRVADERVAKAYVDENLHLSDQSFTRSNQHALANVTRSEDNRALREQEWDRRFMKDIQFKKVYAPLAALGQDLFLFDHLNGRILKMGLDGARRDSVPINYHEDKRWQRKLIIDQVADVAYAHYDKGGYSYLLPINPETGETGEAIKLSHRYPEKIKVRDGVAFYLYRPFESFQRKYLYQQRL